MGLICEKKGLSFIWGDKIGDGPAELEFTYTSNEPLTYIRLAAADFYRVFADGKFISYGPERTAAGYLRERTVVLPSAREVAVKVVGYGVPNYSCDYQSPLFGAEVGTKDGAIATSEDFKITRRASRRFDVPRFSIQRGFVEVYDFTDKMCETVEKKSVPSPTILCGEPDRCDYSVVYPSLVSEGPSVPFDEVRDLWWANDPAASVPRSGFSVERDFLDKIGEFREEIYEFPREVSGFLNLDVESDGEAEIFAVFDEVLPGGKWIFRRSDCNDFLSLKVNGNTSFVSAEPYAFKFLKILVKGDAKVRPSAVLYQNDRVGRITIDGDEKLSRILEAAKASFRQNSADIFTDCPGRERAGWLCDSYFTGMAERLFTGKNDAERKFLENIIISSTPELPDGMLPMCFPSEHKNGTYITNWAMWFVIEFAAYRDRTDDVSLVGAAKEKIYALIKFFEKLENEYGLLENLPSWVFIEWSDANRPEYVSGVNFPSNMLYAKMLSEASRLYGDAALEKKAERVRDGVKKISFDGKFFVDNAVRVDGRLTACSEHITETCQYYALFTDMDVPEKYVRFIIEKFGPKRKGYQNVGKSNMFIGFYLRLFYLAGIGEYDRVLDECVDYFHEMALASGTLWENSSPHASCNHGFTSSAACLLLKCLTGYETVENGVPVFDKNFKKKERGINVTFEYEGGKVSVSV